MLRLCKIDQKRLEKILERKKKWTKRDESRLNQLKRKFGERNYLVFRLWFSDDCDTLRRTEDGRRYRDIRVLEKARGKLHKVM